MNKGKIFLCLILIGISFFIWNCSSNKSKEISVNVYMVALQGTKLHGKLIGCNDILVPSVRTVLVEGNEVEASMNELLSAKDTEELKNFVKGPALLLYQATTANGVADVYLKGDFNISTICDIQRIKEQLYETAKQFSEIKRVNIFINDQTLESYLSLAEQGFK